MSNLLGIINNSTILGIGQEIGDFFINFLGVFLWSLCDIFFVLIHLFEMLFKKFAGIGEGVTDASGNAIEGDLVLYFTQSNLVQEIFMAILILSLFLLIIFTIFAVVKNQYADKQEPVSKIINSSFKALLMYLLVPVATVVCLMVGNVVLVAIDGATRVNTTGGSSDMLFMAASYNANKLRDESETKNEECLIEMIKSGYLIGIRNELETRYQLDFSSSLTKYGVTMLNQDDFEDIAVLIDDAFTAGKLGAGDKWLYSNVSHYYNIMKISLITVWAGGAFLIWIIGKITWGLVSRLFKMTLYFAISPAVMATFPIDNGKALGSWRGEMVKNGTMAFVSVGVTNVLYSFLPFFNGINLFGSGGIGAAGSWIANQVLKLFMYIIAFSSAQDLISSISGWFGTGDAVKEGKATKKMIDDPLKKYSTKAVGVAGAFRGGWKDAKDHGGNPLWGALRGGWSQTGFSDNLKPYADALKKGKDAGKEASKNALTRKGFLNREVDDDKLAAYEAYDIIKAETEEIQKKERDINDRREKEKDRITSDFGYAAGSAGYVKKAAEIDKKYNKMITELKSSAGHIQTLYEPDLKSLEHDKKMNDKREGYYGKVESLATIALEDSKLRERLLSASGLKGNAAAQMLVSRNWKKMREGDFSSVRDAAMRTQLEQQYKQMEESFIDNGNALEVALRNVKNLYKSGDAGKKFATRVLGSDIDFTTGKITTSLDAVMRKIDAERQAINDEVERLKNKEDKLKVEMEHKLGNISNEERQIIGERSKKK